MSLEAIKWKDGKLEILDQLLLPLESKYIPITNTVDGWEAIHKMQVRGAPAIAIVGCLSLAAELSTTTATFDTGLVNELEKRVCQKLDYLVTARPTAVNMQSASRDLNCFIGNGISDMGWDVKQLREKIIEWCVQLLDDDVETNRRIGQVGFDDIVRKIGVDGNASILTHCNTGSLATAGYGTALGVVRCLHANKRLGHVYCTETRPYNQGARLTAYELVYEKMPATLICDNMAGALMKEKCCDAVVVGADRVAANGDTANKIGTYQLAVLAHFHNIPFYVCAPRTSIDLTLASGKDIPIEQRPHHEMTHVAGIRLAAPGIECWNPAFDVTPASLITGGIVTEIGLFEPHNLGKALLNSH